MTFEVDATLIGALNFKDLGEADFSFNGYLEQHLLDYIHDELLNLFTRAEQAAEEGTEAATKQVATEQAALVSRITQAKAQLVASQATWEAHQKSVTETNLKLINDYNAKVKALQASVTSAEKAYDAAVHDAQTNLTNAQHDRQVKIQAAENDLANVKRKTASDTEAAKKRVAAAEAKMNHDFGSAEKNTEDAKRKVQNLQNWIDSINHETNSLNHGPWYKRLNIPGLGVQPGSLEASLKISQGVLDAAQAILRSDNYLAEKSALDAAQRNLDLAEQTGLTLISDSQQILTSIDHLTQATVDRATEALRTVRSGSEKIALDDANAVLAAYKRTDDVVFENANKAISDLVNSMEYVAFEAPTTVLAAAQSATKGLDAANNLLCDAEKSWADVLHVCKAIVGAGTEALSVNSVHISGSLRKSVSGAGLTADVKGAVMKKPFEITVDLDPSKAEDFLTDIFRK